jgi:hypothetical protein
MPGPQKESITQDSVFLPYVLAVERASASSEMSPSTPRLAPGLLKEWINLWKPELFISSDPVSQAGFLLLDLTL